MFLHEDQLCRINNLCHQAITQDLSTGQRREVKRRKDRIKQKLRPYGNSILTNTNHKDRRGIQSERRSVPVRAARFLMRRVLGRVLKV